MFDVITYALVKKMVAKAAAGISDIKFSNGELMVPHIPLIITPQGEDFGNGSYQEAVVEFDKRG